MARIRTIKPEFWSSEQVLELSRDARLLFIGLWNFADDKGRFRWSARTIRAQIFPGDDDMTTAAVEQLLSSIARRGLVECYTNGHDTFGEVIGWHHQRIDRPQKPKYPGPNDSQSIRRSVDEWSQTVRVSLAPDLKGREGSVEERSVPAPAHSPEPDQPSDQTALAHLSSLIGTRLVTEHQRSCPRLSQAILQKVLPRVREVMALQAVGFDTAAQRLTDEAVRHSDQHSKPLAFALQDCEIQAVHRDRWGTPLDLDGKMVEPEDMMSEARKARLAALRAEAAR